MSETFWLTEEQFNKVSRYWTCCALGPLRDII